MTETYFCCIALGIAPGWFDIDAGRFKTFETKQGVRDHMQGLAAKVRTVK